MCSAVVLRTTVAANQVRNIINLNQAQPKPAVIYALLLSNEYHNGESKSGKTITALKMQGKLKQTSPFLLLHFSKTTIISGKRKSNYEGIS